MQMGETCLGRKRDTLGLEQVRRASSKDLRLEVITFISEIFLHIYISII